MSAAGRAVQYSWMQEQCETEVRVLKQKTLWSVKMWGNLSRHSLMWPSDVREREGERTRGRGLGGERQNEMYSSQQ